jgi:methylmalonyl-CoA mutase cobalamin-binding domain/chain
MLYHEDAGYILRLKNALAELNKESAVRVARDYISKSPFPQFFFVEVVPGALELIEKEWAGRIISQTQIYRLGRVLMFAFDYVLEHYEKVFESAPKDNGKNVKIVIATFNDWHELGKLIIANFLKFSGYEVEDLGVIATLDGLVKAVEDKKPDILAISVLMLNSALRLESLRQMLDDQGLQSVKIIAGGAPFRFIPDLAKKLRFDGTADSPLAAISLVKELTEVK